MATKLNLSVTPEVAALMHRRAQERAQPVSRYVAELVEEDAKQHQAALMAEGYRVLAAESEEFAELAFPAGAETWPEFMKDECAAA